MALVTETFEPYDGGLFTLHRVLMKVMVCAPKALKGMDTLDPSPTPSYNIAMKMQSIQFLTSSPHSQEHLLYQHDIF